MSLFQTIATGLRSVAGHRLRSMLTALGILIGVAAVIATVGVGQASQDSVNNRLSALGTNQLTVTPGSITSGGVRGGAGSASTLTLDDAAALGDHTGAPDVQSVAPIVQRSEPMKNGTQTWTSTAAGSSPGWLAAENRTLSSGEFFTDADVRAHAHTVVLGTTTALNLGAGVGDTINIGSTPFQVVGVLTAQGGSGFTNQDDTAVVPISTAQDELTGGSRSVQRIVLSSTSADTLSAAEQEVTALLLQSHHIGDPIAADFSVSSPTSILSTAQSVSQTLTVLLTTIATISLLVGGIGVMNIMLVSVTERIGEIGLRKALGATRRDILRQFLVEAASLSIIGGVLGVGLGLLCVWVLPKLFSIAIVVSWPAVLGSVVVAAAVGLVFGVYPASRASRLAPIEALRSQ